MAIAQLCIVDGAWQDSPDNLAIVDEPGRGTLCLLTEVAGESEGRDMLAREMIETARREYLASRGSVTLALTRALQAANDFFFNFNASTSPESRRIAGITAVVVRETEVFIAQGGPGLTCHVRGRQLAHFPDESPWFDPGDAVGDLTTPGSMPLGKRREYTPDIFHLKLAPGDIILLATRELVHLLSWEELLDTCLHRHPDKIVENLEDVAGAADLSAIVVRLAGEGAPDESDLLSQPITVEASDLQLAEDYPPALAAYPPEALSAISSEDDEWDIEEETNMEFADDQDPAMERAQAEEEDAHQAARAKAEQEQQRIRTQEERERQRVKAEEDRERQHLRAEQARVARAQVWGGVLGALAGAVGALGGIFSKINWTSIGTAADKAISTFLRGVAFFIIFAIHAFLPGESEATKPSAIPVDMRTAWRLAALFFPLFVLGAGGLAWIQNRAENQRVIAGQVATYIDQANGAIDQGKALSKTDKNGAKNAFQKAMNLAQQAQKLGPNNANARTVYYTAEDQLNTLNGISMLYLLPRLATFPDSKTNITRIVSHVPDVFFFDRGLQRIYRYTLNDTGSGATPAPGDGIILKAGDRIGERTVGELIDILWIDSTRLVALDRNGLFLIYDPVKSAWSARAATDGSQWTRVTLASSYSGNLYMLDPAKNQISKYVASAEAVWSSSVTYFAPGTNVDLSTAVDMTIDGDVWVLRQSGSIWRFTSGKAVDFTLRDFDPPLVKPTALFTSQTMVGLYLADAGNQRVIQFDKVTGKFMRQFKPSSAQRDAFNSLKALAVDEASKKFFFVNGNQAYAGTVPQ